MKIDFLWGNVTKEQKKRKTELAVRRNLNNESNENMEESISRLKNMLKWSDRIGSDEIHEIRSIIKLLEDE